MRLFVTLVLLSACGASDPGRPGDHALLPDFSLLDVNPNSPSYDSNVSPLQFRGNVSAWYFSHATCGYCRNQFGFLDVMQNELDAEVPEAGIRIIGINEVGLEAGNAEVVAERDLPWLQDTAAVDAWGLWEANWRDVVVLDAEGRRAYVVNLTDFDLADEDNFATLKATLIDPP